MPFSFQPNIPPEGTSTAPSAPLAGTVGSTAQNLMVRASSAGKSLAEILLFVLLGCTILITIGLFGYKFFLSSQVEAKKQKLAGYESQLAGLPIEDMRKLSNRLKVINQLVREHPSVNVAFLIVEASVENMITFNKFNLNYSETFKSYKLDLGGVAPDYKSIAQQMDTYKRKPYSDYVSKVSVEGLQPDTSGKITFSFSMPISITGLIPETFSIVDGSAAVARPEGSMGPASVATTTDVGASSIGSGQPLLQ